MTSTPNDTPDNIMTEVSYYWLMQIRNYVCAAALEENAYERTFKLKCVSEVLSEAMEDCTPSDPMWR